MTKKTRKGRRGFIFLLILALTLTMIPTTAFAGRDDHGSGIEYVAITINGGPETIVDSSTSHNWLTNGTYSVSELKIVDSTSLFLSVQTSNGLQTYTAVLSEGYVFDENSEVTYGGVNSQHSTYDNIVINVTATKVDEDEDDPPVVVVNPGSLTITKTATEGFAVPETAAFTVTNGIVTKTAVYADFVGGSYTFTGLEPGEYTVTETGGEIEGATWTYEVSTESVTVVSNQNASVTIANNYVADEQPPVTPPVDPPPTPDPEGNLKITKTAAEGFAVPETAAFIIRNAEGKEILTISYALFIDGVYVAEGLEPGEYTVEETGGEIEGAIWNYSVEYADGEAAVVTDGGTAEVEVYNGYEEEITYTSLYVQKVWDLSAGGEMVPVQVQLTVNGTPEGEAVTLNADNNWEYMWDALYNDGSVYSAVEVNVPENFTAAYNQDAGEMIITNTYVPPTPPTPPTPPITPIGDAAVRIFLDGEMVDMDEDAYLGLTPGTVIVLGEADIEAYKPEAEGKIVTYDADAANRTTVTIKAFTTQLLDLYYVTEDPVDPPVDPPVNPPVDPPYIPWYPPYVPDVPEVEPPVEPPVEIEEPEVPLADEPVEIEEPEVPLAEAPKTGDNMMAWAMIALASLAGLAALRRDRKNETDN